TYSFPLSCRGWDNCTAIATPARGSVAVAALLVTAHACNEGGEIPVSLAGNDFCGTGLGRFAGRQDDVGHGGPAPIPDRNIQDLILLVLGNATRRQAATDSDPTRGDCLRSSMPSVMRFLSAPRRGARPSNAGCGSDFLGPTQPERVADFT